MTPIHVVGGGLAGCEAAWQAVRQGVPVILHEMKPSKMTPAHHSGLFGELVCSNSFRSNQLENAVGLLKEEMRRLGSLILEAADACRVPAGGALAVDRTGFARYITDQIQNHPGITVMEEEVTRIPDEGIWLIASGPLTSEGLAQEIIRITGSEELFFFDAAAPLVERDSIDFSKAFLASRYNKGEADYINCPMNEEEYTAFWEALVSARSADLHAIDTQKPQVFEGCMPVEVMAKRGKETLLYGPLKPVGLTDPKTGKHPYAVVQLRQDNAAASVYNLVGFQTHLTFSEQKRVFSMIPGLENAAFLRYGVMHRNTFLNSPVLLHPDYSLRKDPRLFFAGQMTGVEGYVESASSGLVAGFSAAKKALGEEYGYFTDETAIGALARYVSHEDITSFQPMNVNFGIIAPLERQIKAKKRKRNLIVSNRALEQIEVLRRTIERIYP
ncbi:MAG TPA: methylenetetrahydrofolate--tRNA-(uracil(54)-C(5))-methyltransferase (FADH(2)-oxidizing) TrmFO [Clostridiales bacterium]|jgi:methylenetetrahydrofolate--tRNA-(uracil-5-)-methyltransferase|nr:methylenetetrahydrofolate--tRNA-(uracil(54)-C(5))-methyltransferase (FADH(2)-oxidizing) TrmFO [Clostridiales bacterium]